MVIIKILMNINKSCLNVQLFLKYTQVCLLISLTGLILNFYWIFRFNNYKVEN